MREGGTKRSFWEFVERDQRRVDVVAEAVASKVIDAAIEVHRHLGPGHPERVYENAFCVELDLRHIGFSRQHPLRVRYKQVDVGDSFVDLLIEQRVVIELKAVEVITPTFVAQTASYLTALNLELGLLINFNVPLLKDGIRRVIRSRR